MTTINQMKIAIYGAGAMGTVLGGLLTLGGLKNVRLITRNEKHVQGLNEKGAQIVCMAENNQLTVPVTALLPSKMTEKYDVVFLMTKQKNNAEILRFLLPYLHEESIVCTMQNGLPESLVASVVGEKRTYGGVVSFGASFIGEGKVALTSKTEGMSLQVAGYKNDEEKTDLLVEILSYAGKAIGNDDFAKRTQNLLGARWSKLAINSAFSGLSVVTGCSFGEIAKRRKSKRIALGILRECLEVANASGVILEKMQGRDMQKLLGGTGFFKTGFALFALPIAMKKHKRLLSGMLRDVKEGRKCEIDFINGAVVAEGKRVGVKTPLCEKVVELVHGVENGLYEISYKNTDFFELNKKEREER